MESDTMFRQVVARALPPLLCAIALASAVRPVRAQVVGGAAEVNASIGHFEFAGSWLPLATEDLASDSVPVDYQGLPLTEEARDRALTYSESRLGMVDHQCEAWPTTYLMTGPFGLKVYAAMEPIKGSLVSYTISGWPDRLPMTIWMDGRPHPSKRAAHTRAGFTTGRWDGSTLVTYTTHMKDGNLRKTGPPLSDDATMTIRYYRHGDLLTAFAVVEDPIYLTEPLLWSRTFQSSRDETNPQVLACITTFEGTTLGDSVPHFSPTTNPYIDEMTRKYGMPRAAVLGFPETLYPEYRGKMRAP